MPLGPCGGYDMQSDLEIYAQQCASRVDEDLWEGRWLGEQER